MNNGLPTVPEYFKKHVNPNIDLDTELAIPCPFHKEIHGKSLTWSPAKKMWRCWGACHMGGGVIEMHMLNFRIKTKEEAKASLYSMYGIEDKPTFVKKDVNVNPEEVKRRAAYSNAIRAAKTPEDWIELDYIMSMSPADPVKLEMFAEMRKGVR